MRKAKGRGRMVRFVPLHTTSLLPGGGLSVQRCEIPTRLLERKEVEGAQRERSSCLGEHPRTKPRWLKSGQQKYPLRTTPKERIREEKRSIEKDEFLPAA